MKVDGITLEAIGSYLPPATRIADAVEAGLFERSAAAESAQESVLIAGDESAPDMAVTAARTALARSGREAHRIDALIHASVFMQGPEMWTPPGYILRELGARDIPAIELRQGCNGMLSALEAAVFRLVADPASSSVLLTTAENLNSPLLDRWRGGIIGLFGADGAAAAVVGTGPGFATVDAINSAVFSEIEGMARGAEPLFPPPSATAQPFDLVDRTVHFAQTVRPLPETTEVIRKGQLDLAQQTLAEAGADLDDMRRVLYVNGARWLMHRNLTEPFGIELERTSWEIGRTIGHMGAGDHMVSLERLLLDGALEAGDRVLIVGGAPGWSVTTVVLTITDPPAWAG
ncbi:ketoacyl-ACP synthase III family protein [Actinoplanes sp. NPDC051861]|uniref:ketoacyl-ACP synthase III family protein n=1 Tax=Actinoplanes sp. NPDC051861 TaxID=3155170 RepID=UPI00341ACA6F